MGTQEYEEWLAESARKMRERACAHRAAFPTEQVSPNPVSINPAEQTILDRIYTRWPIPTGLNRRLPLNTRRYYLAYATGAQCAVLRLKNRQGLEEWRQRQWRLFDTAPTITDVTMQVLELIETILEMGREETRFVNVWALLEPVPHLVATGRLSERPSGSIPLWQFGPNDRFDMPIDLFRNDSHRIEQYLWLDSHPLSLKGSFRADALEGR